MLDWASFTLKQPKRPVAAAPPRHSSQQVVRSQVLPLVHLVAVGASLGQAPTAVVSDARVGDRMPE